MIKRRMAPLAAALAVAMLFSVPMAWSATVTPGGVNHVGEQAIAYVVAEQGTFAGAGAATNIKDMLDNAEPVLVDPNKDGATQLADEIAATAIPGADEALDRLGYSVRIEPRPDITPSDDPNDIGVDIIIPNQFGVHLTGLADTAAIVQYTAEETAGTAYNGVKRQIAIVRTSVEEYTLIVVDDVKNIDETTRNAVEAIRNGTWENVRVETCVLVDSDSGQKIAVGVPAGLVGSWTPSDPYQPCPATPISTEGDGAGVDSGPIDIVVNFFKDMLSLFLGTDAPDLPGTPDIPGAPGLPGAPDLPAAPAVPELPATPDPALPGIPATPDLPALPDVPDVPIPDSPGLPPIADIPELPTEGSPGDYVNIGDTVDDPTSASGGLPVDLSALPTSLPGLPAVPSLPVAIPGL